VTTEPDVDVSASVTARKLRFRRAPRVTTHADETVSRRFRLPRPVRAGVTYRWISAATRLSSRWRARSG
jgi:hypothetical protein